MACCGVVCAAIPDGKAAVEQSSGKQTLAVLLFIMCRAQPATIGFGKATRSCQNERWCRANRVPADDRLAPWHGANLMEDQDENKKRMSGT